MLLANRKKLFFLILTVIILAGIFLRFYNLNWDQGNFFHPDERNIANAVTRIVFFEQLNPQFFAYGSLPIYLYRATGDFLTLVTKNPDWTSQWPLINLIGRFYSALFASLSLILIFLLAKKIFNKKVGFLAVFIAAFSPSLIQTAHFGVTESMMVFWSLLIALVSFELFSKKENLMTYFKIGLLWGASLATKMAGLSFLIIPLTAHLLTVKKLKKQFNFLLIPLITFLIFTIFSPYAFLSWGKFLESMNYENGVVLGKLRVVYTLQFTNTLPYLFQAKNIIWQMGPVALSAVLSLFVLLFVGLKKRNKKILTLLVFPIAYFLYVGYWYTKFVRYMVPILPFLAIMAGWGLDKLIIKTKTFGKIIAFIFLTVTLFWGLAFFNVYLQTSTRITASQWIYQNIKPNSKILIEHWDDGLPVTLKDKNPSIFQIDQLTIYEPDNEEKINYYAQALADSDYLIINSRRLYGTLMFLPEKYPLTSYYYQLLFSGQLGYNKVAQFSVYPQLLGLTINDDQAEESFQVYDHPKVMIFQNVKDLTQAELKTILSQQ